MRQREGNIELKINGRRMKHGRVARVSLGGRGFSQRRRGKDRISDFRRVC